MGPNYFGGDTNPRINIESMSRISLAAASLSAWINNWLDVAQLSDVKSTPKTPIISAKKLPKKTWN